MERRVIRDLLLGFLLTLTFFFAIITVPVLGLVIGLFTPLPIALYFRKVGIKYGMLMLSAVVAFISVMAGIRIGALFLAEFASMGVALSESARRKLPIGKGVMLPASASIIGGAILLMAFSSYLDKGITDIIEEHIRQNISEGIEAYKRLGIPEGQIQDIEGIVGRLEALILKTYPSIFFVGTISLSFLNILALKSLLKRKGMGVYDVDFTLWRSPEPLVWVLIAGGGLLLLKLEWAGAFGLNLIIITGGIYLFQGLAIVAFYFKKMETPLFFRALGYILIFLQQIFTILIVALGLFDLWFDFRRLKKEV